MYGIWPHPALRVRPRILGVSSGPVPVGGPLAWVVRTGDENPRLTSSLEGSGAHCHVLLQETWDFRPRFGIWGGSPKNRAFGLGRHAPAPLKFGTHLNYPIARSVPENLAAPKLSIQSVKVITSYRDCSPSLQTHIRRIIKQVGEPDWPKLYHNLRAFRQKELEAQFPLHVVCSWIGNSVAVAPIHY